MIPKKNRDREETRKKELEEKEQNRVLKALKKANLNRKQCDCGLKYEEEIKCNKSRWLSCFKCGIWCCFDCLPEGFKVNKISNLYFCGSCSKNNENLFDHTVIVIGFFGLTLIQISNKKTWVGYRRLHVTHYFLKIEIY